MDLQIDISLKIAKRLVKTQTYHNTSIWMRK